MPERPAQPNCPFYGFRWPARGSHLFRVLGNECGLDFERHGPCQMEQRGDRVDFDQCQLRLNLQHLWDAGKNHIRFHAPDLPSTGLIFECWKDRVLRGKKSASS